MIGSTSRVEVSVPPRKTMDPLNGFERLCSVPKRIDVNVHFVHHAHEEAAHLSIGFLEVVEVLAALNSTATPSQHDHREFGGVVMPSLHGGA